MLEYFAARAKGGVGLITSGLVPISHGIDPSVTELGDLTYFPRIDRSRSVFAGWRDIAARCHAYGARFFIQLTPGLGRVGSPECLINKWKLPVSSSWNPNFYMPALPCRPISGREAKRIIKNAGQAAADARAALIDGVYLHGHEGYLLEQMTNPAFNRRKLGRFADYEAFGIDMVKEIRRRTDKRYPIMYRIDLSLVLAETYGERMRSVKSLSKFRGERTVDMTLSYMAHLVAAGVDIFDVDLGCYDNWWLPHPPAPMPPGCFLEVARIAKEYLEEHGIRSNAGLPVPVVAVGKLGYPDLAEKALRDGKCDMVMLGRPLLADPEWPNKAFSGRVKEIVPCIGDQEGCINEFVEGGHPQCAVNPRTGFEDIYSGAELAAAEHPKRVAVVGGGPAGVLTACIASMRGHSVKLYERDKNLCGMLNPGGRPKIKFDIVNYRNYLLRKVDACVSTGRLQVEYSSTVTPESLKAAHYDVIVTATGTRQVFPKVPGMDKPQVISAIDLLGDPSRAEAASDVVVVGGGEVGCETAFMLAAEMGKRVKVVEMLPVLMKGVCTANRGYLIHYLEELGVELLNCARIAEVGDGEVIIIRNISKTVPDPYVTWSPVLPENVENPLAKPIRVSEEKQTLKADLVVVATGGVPADEFFLECQRIQAAQDVRNIADSFMQGRILEATR
ncbi:MAG TPA: FAD-dependent oxidoreductase, partial [Spirochaetia bacterium]|nr:FAD-dependent oxidoreductase [Spirochaetia bacterium]